MSDLPIRPTKSRRRLAQTIRTDLASRKGVPGKADDTLHVFEPDPSYLHASFMAEEDIYRFDWPHMEPAAPNLLGRSIHDSVVRIEPVGHAQSSLLPKHFRQFRSRLKHADFSERVRIEREGVPATVVVEMIDNFGLSTTAFQRLVDIPPATYKKRVRENDQFAGAIGHSVVGLMDLINKVEDMLAAETENEEARHFDVAAWVGEWIQRPQKALGGLTPAELMDTPSGRESVMRVLGAIQSGAYQ